MRLVFDEKSNDLEEILGKRRRNGIQGPWGGDGKAVSFQRENRNMTSEGWLMDLLME